MVRVSQKNVTVATRCPVCEQTAEIELAGDSFDRWRGGALVQVAFPEIPTPVRDQRLSGTCPDCWVVLFG